MSRLSIHELLQEIEGLLALAGDLPVEAELAVEKLLNVVETLSADRQSLADEVQRLKEQLSKKKKDKMTGKGSKPRAHHSSEKRRAKRRAKKSTSAQDRRTFKDLTIEETIECPVAPEKLPPMRCVSKTQRSSSKTSRSSRTTSSSCDMCITRSRRINISAAAPGRL